MTIHGGKSRAERQAAQVAFTQDKGEVFHTLPKKLDEEQVLEEIEKRLHTEQRACAEFARAHICPVSSTDIADDDTAARLVILKPQYPHALRDHNSQACRVAKELLDARGNTRRSYRNMLVFLAADRNCMEELKQGVRQYLAWNSMNAEREALNLDAFQLNQASTKLKEANDMVETRIPETYTWLLVPDPRQRNDLQELKLQPQLQASLASNASRQLKMTEMLLTQYAGMLLRRELDRIPLWRGDYVSLKELADFFARYVYRPRLKSSDVLLDAIREGLQSLVWQQETFAYADDCDYERGRFLGLKARQQIAVTLNNNAVLVKLEVAAAQMAADAVPVAPASPAQLVAPAQGTTLIYAEVQEKRTPFVVEPGLSALSRIQVTPATPLPKTNSVSSHRFHGSVKIGPHMMAGDAGKINEEVVKHLTMILGAHVQVTLEIQADIPDGVPNETARTVTENCRTLKFEDFGFEEE